MKAKKAKQAAAPEAARTVRRELREVPVAALRHAEWNPRSAAELEETHPEMEKLVASVRARGVVQPIAVWDRGESGGMIVIAGNRRFAAAKIAGLETVPAAVFDGLTDAEAREITRIENEVRLGVSPLKDAELIGAMIRDFGYSQREVAAHFGVSEATVCRRMKLADLEPSIRAVAEETGALSADALERIALYPAAVQAECARDVQCAAKRAANAGGASVRWDALRPAFSRTARTLDGVSFAADGRCAKCPNRTGAAADLWGDVTDGSLGLCLDVRCFEKRRDEWLAVRARDEASRALRGAPHVSFGGMVCGEAEGVPEWEARRFMVEPPRMFADKPTPECDFAWWWRRDFAGEVSILWGPSAAEYHTRIAEIEKAQEAERAANAETRERLRALERAEDAAWDEAGKAFSRFQELVIGGVKEAAGEVSGVFKPSALTEKQFEALVALAIIGAGEAPECTSSIRAEVVALVLQAGIFTALMNIDGDACRRYLAAVARTEEAEEELKP